MVLFDILWALKKVLEDTLTDSFRVLSNTLANGETTYNFEQIVSAANSLGIPMGRPDDTMDKVVAASAKRQSSANAWDKIESGAFNREAYVTGPLIKNFAENERGMALNILGDALELGNRRKRLQLQLVKLEILAVLLPTTL